MFEKIVSLIKKYNSIVIFGHIFPDGDCFGSQIALRETLKLSFPNKEIYVTGSGYRRFITLIGNIDNVSDEIIKNSLAIILDGNDLNRMEDQRVHNASAWAKIDHHVDNGLFTEGPQVIDENANSTCELICDFIKENKYKINEVIATALYIGILTDTGRFQFVQDFPKCFKQVAWLCERGAKVKDINFLLNITSELHLRFRAYVYNHYKKSNKGVAYCVFNKNVLKKFGFTASNANSMVNLISNIKGYPIWVFFSQDEQTNHVEIRSNGPFIQQIASKYGGGGHQQAAGFTLTSFSNKKINEIIDELGNLNSKEGC